MKKFMFFAAIMMMVSVVFISCNNSKSETSKMSETPVTGTDFFICKTVDGSYGVKKGTEMVISPEYQSMTYSHGMFIADHHIELYGVVADNKVLLSPNGNVKLTGQKIEFADGNFVSEDKDKKGVYIISSGYTYAQLDDYALSEEDKLIVTEMDGKLGAWSLKRDTLIEATGDYKKMIILKGKKQLLTLTDNKWFVINFTKGEAVATPVSAAELKGFKKKAGWSDTKNVFNL